MVDAAQESRGDPDRGLRTGIRGGADHEKVGRYSNCVPQ
jgi:hypothetical protein